MQTRALLAVALLAAMPAGPAAAGPALVVDAGTGTILHQYQASRRWYPASLTKLVSLYVVFQAIEEGRIARDAPVPISARAAAETVNTLGLAVGQEIALDEAIPILVVKSANDVAIAVAESVGGSVEDFVAEMNETAERLGMMDSRFVNPHGLHDPRHYSSARDVALVSLALIRDFPEWRHVFALGEVSVGAETYPSPNRLFGRLAGADGLKTGYLCASGWNIAASATRGETRLVAIVLGGVAEGQREEVAADLLDAGFAAQDAESPPRPTLADLPAGDGAEPIDMRPYACEGRAPPDAIASFGEHAPDPAALPRPRP